MDIQTVLQIFSIIIVPACSGIVVFLSWHNNRKIEQIKILQERLNEKKHEAYAKAVSMFYNVLKDQHANRKQNIQKRMDEMTDIKRDIFMYGSDKVFLAFNLWLLHTTSQKEETVIQLKDFLQFVLEIRKDLSGDDTKVTAVDVLVNLTQNEEEAKLLMNRGKFV